MPPTLAARLVEGKPAYAWGEADAGPQHLWSEQYRQSQVVSVQNRSLWWCDCSENRSAVVPQTATEPRSGASLWFGSPANLSESLIVGRGAFTLANELYLRPRKRMRPVKARPLYTL